MHNSFYKFKLATLFGAGVNLFFIFTGILIHNTYNKKPEFLISDKYIATIQEIPREKLNSYQSVVEIHAVVMNDSIIRTHEKVIVSFAKCEKSKFIKPGQMIVFIQSPEMVSNNNNPFEFDYKLYLERQQIYRQVYLSADSWGPSCKSAPFSFSIIAEKARLFLLKIYSQQNWDENQMNIISALTLGYKSGLDAEIKNLFISAGVMHVLAVSGLHVGILFLLLNFIFGFLRKQHTGRIFFILVVVISIWGFAFITGLSPSVKRAAIMFTFIVIGQNLKRQSNIYNTVSASAFFILIVNPNNLYAVGFQLSYLAVLGIVSLQPRIEKLFQFKFFIFRYLWSLLAVSFAAQIAIFPLTVFYFHQFPSYFWLTNMLVIPAATILIPLGIFLLAFSWIPYFSNLISEAIHIILTYLIKFLELVENFPGSVIQINFTIIELMFIIAVVAFFVFFINFPKIKYIKCTLAFMLLYLITSLAISTFNYYRHEIIVYNYSKQNVLHLIAGKRNYIVSESKLEGMESIHSIINNTIVGLSVNSPIYLTGNQYFNDSILYLNNGLIFFNGKIIHFTIKKKQWNYPFYPDIIIADKKTVMENNSKNYSAKTNFSENKQFSTSYNVREKGAFRKKWYMFGKFSLKKGLFLTELRNNMLII